MGVSAIRREIPFAEPKSGPGDSLSRGLAVEAGGNDRCARPVPLSTSTPPRLPKSLKSNEALSLRNHRKVPIALAASAAGFGFGLIERAGLTSKREIGRCVDSVGQRCAGDRTHPDGGRSAGQRHVGLGGSTHQPDEATLDEYIRLSRQGETREARSLINGILGSVPPGPQAKTLTDQDGRFAINGLGADRIAWLELRGPSIPDSFITVITRPVPQGEANRAAVGVIRLMKEPHEMSHYYAHFTHVSEATHSCEASCATAKRAGPCPASTSRPSRHLP